ncbi:U3 small nucleolar RNA-associated protein 15 homolog isoform X1 [Gymnogyps californianus]|uniref:U3 small nucleolar RNA-associated protein 15 homolog isoform X1 n=1 Tax=Gymnogyps californianus TaxID=33616 RepID=UPI0021C75779|nr:U3 small nucleolar RNA-associated protein 15 homolog isoform X1 [Gymnogyps californianus]
MATYKPVVVQTFPKLGERITQDTVYWRGYKTPVQIKEFGAINKIDFSPIPPYNYAVTASSRIHIYGRYSQEPVKTFSRFKDAAYCATYRDDGNLLVAGSEEGSIRLFDISGRAPLRQFDGHTKPVHVVGFLSDKYRIFSGGDDYSSNLWDIPSATEIVSYSEHADYVRCGCTSKVNADVFITGSYDHTVKLFDARTKSSVMTIEHGQPVESVLLFPSGGLLVSAGGRYVKVWDVLKGGQLLVSLKNHHKTVTCLCLNSSGQRLLSGSLDRHVKIYSTTSYKVVHSFNYATSILSLALSPEDETIVVGMTNGVLNVKHRKPEERREKSQKKRQPAYRTYVKGRTYMPKQEDFCVSKPVKRVLRKYDKLLKSFQSSKALDAVLEPPIRLYTPEVTVAVMQELHRRGTLRSALAGRDEKQINLLLTFVARRVIEPRFTPVLVTVADMITDIYQPVVGQSPIVDRQFLRLQEAIGKEIDYQEELLEVLGMMDTLFATFTKKRAAYLEENKSNGLTETIGTNMNN